MIYSVTHEGTGRSRLVDASDEYDAANLAAKELGAVYAQAHTKRACVFVLYEKIKGTHGTYAKSGSVIVREFKT